MHPPKHKGPSEEIIRIGIDIGGTFTDFVVYNPETGELETFKVLSTPASPDQAVMDGLRDYFLSKSINLQEVSLNIVHGSTVATNALLERKGAKTALITTKGFEDILQIGRQNRPSLYDLSFEPVPALIPPQLRFGITERIDHNGNVIIPLKLQEVDQIISDLQSQGVTSVAVCLLFSFLYPEHEKIISNSLRSSGYFSSVSSEILPEYREYERMSTTAVNAYVSPVLDKYLAKLDQALIQNGTSFKFAPCDAVQWGQYQCSGSPPQWCPLYTFWTGWRHCGSSISG